MNQMSLVSVRCRTAFAHKVFVYTTGNQPEKAVLAKIDIRNFKKMADLGYTV